MLFHKDQKHIEQERAQISQIAKQVAAARDGQIIPAVTAYEDKGQAQKRLKKEFRGDHLTRLAKKLGGKCTDISSYRE